MLKYARAVLISFAIGAICGGVLLYVVRGNKPQTITVHDGKVEYVEKTVYKITTNTGACCDDYNNLLTDYNSFMSAPPVFNSADDKRIYFSISKNKYSIAYNVQNKEYLYIAPIIGASVDYNNILNPSVCLGIEARYMSISVGAIATIKNINVFASWSFRVQ